MPAVVDDDFLPDMGRMSGRLPSAARAARAAAVLSLVEIAKLNGLDPRALPP
jgi:hypothetical protein